MVESAADAELQALTSVLNALAPLEPDARSRVLDYVFRRFGLPNSALGSSPPSAIAPMGPAASEPGPALVTDIRSLTDQKKPKSAIEMAPVVAYYLAYLAPEGEKKAELAASDVTKYFHQANFRLPGKAAMTLVHAKNAGYLDAGSKRGSYKLNPVGYNLVAHRLPAGASIGGSAREAIKSGSRRKPGSKARRSVAASKRKARKAR